MPCNYTTITKYELIKGIPVKRKCTAFTIVELLVSLVIISILIGLLLPSIAMVRRKAKETAQEAQFTTMDMALDAFKQDYGDYPPSDGWDTVAMVSADYGGAQKLAEALLGWDLLGFHPDSAWQSDGGGVGGPYDPPNPGQASIQARRGPYLEMATASAYRLGISAPGALDGLYVDPAPLQWDTHVICDVFTAKRLKTTTPSGKTITYNAGTPILYYKANLSSTTMLGPPNNLLLQRYNYYDNAALVNLVPIVNKGNPVPAHSLEDPTIFYSDQGGLIDPKITAKPWPYRPDSYILISAGMDGLYGTRDDITNY